MPPLSLQSDISAKSPPALGPICTLTISLPPRPYQSFFVSFLFFCENHSQAQWLTHQQHKLILSFPFKRVKHNARPSSAVNKTDVLPSPYTPPELRHRVRIHMVNTPHNCVFFVVFITKSYNFFYTHISISYSPKYMPNTFSRSSTRNHMLIRAKKATLFNMRCDGVGCVLIDYQYNPERPHGGWWGGMMISAAISLNQTDRWIKGGIACFG